MSVAHNRKSTSFARCGKKAKLRCEGGNSGRRNGSCVTATPMVGYDRVRLAGVWSQVVGFVFANFDRNVFSVSVKMFSHLIHFIKNVIYFNAVCTEKCYNKLYYC
jgi:hypothetical protein